MREPSSEISFYSLAPLEVVMLVYPGFTLLDLAGSQATWGPYGRAHLVGKSMQPVLSDTDVAVLPTATFAECPRNADILFVPGGFGTNDVMEDPETLAFLGEQGRRARYVTSVCSGSLILGAAGLLRGYKAATHWACYETLEALGVEGVRSRVVVDRNRISGGGVTSGIDFGLTVLAQLRGEITAKVTQLAMEYDPQPPFDAGTPTGAGPEITNLTLSMLGGSLSRGMSIAKRITDNSTPHAA